MRLRTRGKTTAVACMLLLVAAAGARAEESSDPVAQEVAEPVEAEVDAQASAPEPEVAPQEGAEEAAEEVPDVPPGTAAQEPEPSVPGQWAPPSPDAKEFDWLQMKSGEWLKGEFKTLRDYRVAFDSDEFDDVDLDWDKVSSFYLPRPHSYRVQGRVLFGTAELRGDVVRIRTETEVLEFPRNQLVSIAQGTGSERDWWSLHLGAGVTLRQGNTSQTEISADGELRRETAVSRFVLSYRGSYANVDHKRTVNNHRASADLDIYLTRRLYWTIPFVEYYTDEFQQIDVRITPGSGLGYEIVRNGWVDFEASLGAAYQFTRLSPGVDEQRSSHDFAVVVGTELDFDLPGGTDFDNSYKLQLVPTDFGRTNHHAESVLSLDVWGPLDLDVSFIWDRIEKPAQRETDSKTKKDDFRVLVGFGLDF